MAVALIATPALADKAKKRPSKPKPNPSAFVKMPVLEGAGKHLEMRFVRYDGNTNGEMVVDIKNTGKSTELFIADSIYFVPEGDPKSAPQRLGAAGPFRHKSGAKWTSKAKLRLKAGTTARVRLQVFCIDSHRSSPSSRTKFTIAKQRLPKKLRQTISFEAAKEMRKAKGKMPKAAPVIQSKVWEARDADWIEVEGEAPGEAEMKRRPATESSEDAPQRIRHRPRRHR